MPVSFTYDDLFLALAKEAFNDQDIIDIATETASAAAGTTAIFDSIAYGTAGATTTVYHDTYLYFRRFSGLATNGGASTITLRTSMGDLGAANVLADFTAKITAGTSSGDERLIASNTDANPTVVTVSAAFTTTPDTTSFYEIYPSSSTADRIVRVARAPHTASFAAATGTVTVAPALAGAVGAALSMGIGADFIFCPENPRLLRDSIQRVLRNMRYPAYLPVTLITDGDMEDTGTDNWAQVTGGTIAKSDTTDSGLPFGRQVLHVSAAGDQEGATSNAVSVDPGEILNVAVPIDLVAGSADVILYDSTNSTALQTVNVTEFLPSMVFFQQSAESTTKNVTVRLLGSEASSEFYAGPVFMWSGQRKRYAADTSSLERGRDIKAAFTLRLGDPIETDVYYIGDLRETTFSVERDDRANLVNVNIPYSSYPTLIQGDRRYVELPYDTSTTFAERDMVVQGAMYHIERARAARMMADNPSLAGFHNSRAREYARTYSRMLESLGITLVDVEDESSGRQAVRFR